MSNKIYEYINNERALLITQITEDNNVLVPVYPGRCIYINEKYNAYVNRYLTKINEYTLPQEREPIMTTLIQRLSKVLDHFMATSKQFTLLDVSNAIKDDGGDFVRHTEVRDTVKPILDIIMKHNSVYEIHQITVNTPKGIDVADLYTPYHISPYHISPDDYVDVSQVASKPKFNMNQIQNHPSAQPIPVPANIKVVHSSYSSQSVPDVAKRANDYKFVKPRSDGAINVPKFLFEEAGFIDGDGVDIVNHPNSISIVPGSTRSLSDDGDFRISKTALENSNIFNESVYVCAFSDKIVIAVK